MERIASMHIMQPIIKSAQGDLAGPFFRFVAKSVWLAYLDNNLKLIAIFSPMNVVRTGIPFSCWMSKNQI